MTVPSRGRSSRGGGGRGGAIRPPGPRGLPLLGILPQLRSDPLRAFIAAADGYGDFVGLRFGPYRGYLLSDPDGIKHVLQENDRNYHKSPTYRRLEEGIGRGLLTSEDAFWLRQRRLAQPAFHHQRLAAMVDTMVAEIERTLDRWDGPARRGEEIELAEEMVDLTQRIIVRTMFSIDLGPAAEVVKRSWPIVNRHIGETFWATRLETRLPLPSNLRFRRALRELDAVVYRIIDERRRSGADEPDLLSLFMGARDEETGERMNDRQLRDELMTMLLAGHETTSLALAWTHVLLGGHPDVAERMADEADVVLGDRRPTMAEVEGLELTRKVFEESLRLEPPAWGFSRIALAEDRICGWRVPEGSFVFIVPYVVHRRPGLWPDPGRFDPERFSAAGVAERPKFAYLPFGGGPRQCIGSRFATVEALLTLAMIARRYRVRPVAGQRIVEQPLITLRPAPGVRARVDQRGPTV